MILIVFFILKGIIKLYTDKGYPFIKYKEGEMFGDSDTLLNVLFSSTTFYYFLKFLFDHPLNHYFFR
jgi:hypothetical protein